VTTQEDFQQAISEIQAATQQFLNGDANPIKAFWSHSDDATIMGGWGSYEQTWDQVGPRLEWAAARFLEGQGSFETLASGEHGDLGYSIWIEKYNARVRGTDTVRPLALRVTQIYRREGGAWKIIHRHADAILEKVEATAVLPRGKAL
jgi:ketosteroid isomerase-like protein